MTVVPDEAGSAAIETAPSPDFSDGAMIALRVPQPERFATPDLPGATPAEDLHITLGYLGKADEITPEQRAAVLEACAVLASTNEAPQALFPATQGVFPADPDQLAEGESPTQPFWLAPQPFDEISKLREDLMVQLGARGVGDLVSTKHPIFNPHVTLAYIPEGGISPSLDLQPLPTAFDTLLVKFGPEAVEFPIAPSLQASLPDRTPPLNALAQARLRNLAAANPHLSLDLLRAVYLRPTPQAPHLSAGTSPVHEALSRVEEYVKGNGGSLTASKNVHTNQAKFAPRVEALLTRAGMSARADSQAVFNWYRAAALAARSESTPGHDALTSLLADGNSSAARSLRVKSQLRDRFGRWIEMGRGVRFRLRRSGDISGGQFVHGTVEGIDVPNGRVNVRMEDGRLVSVPNKKLEQPKAIIGLKTPGGQNPVVGPGARLNTRDYDHEAVRDSMSSMLKAAQDANPDATITGGHIAPLMHDPALQAAIDADPDSDTVTFRPSKNPLKNADITLNKSDVATVRDGLNSVREANLPADFDQLDEAAQKRATNQANSVAYRQISQDFNERDADAELRNAPIVSDLEEVDAPENVPGEQGSDEEVVKAAREAAKLFGDKASDNSPLQPQIESFQRAVDKAVGQFEQSGDRAELAKDMRVLKDTLNNLRATPGFAGDANDSENYRAFAEDLDDIAQAIDFQPEDSDAPDVVPQAPAEATPGGFDGGDLPTPPDAPAADEPLTPSEEFDGENNDEILGQLDQLNDYIGYELETLAEEMENEDNEQDRDLIDEYAQGVDNFGGLVEEQIAGLQNGEISQEEARQVILDAFDNTFPNGQQDDSSMGEIIQQLRDAQGPADLPDEPEASPEIIDSEIDPNDPRAKVDAALAEAQGAIADMPQQFGAARRRLAGLAEQLDSLDQIDTDAQGIRDYAAALDMSVDDENLALFYDEASPSDETRIDALRDDIRSLVDELNNWADSKEAETPEAPEAPAAEAPADDAPEADIAEFGDIASQIEENLDGVDPEVQDQMAAIGNSVANIGRKLAAGEMEPTEAADFIDALQAEYRGLGIGLSGINDQQVADQMDEAMERLAEVANRLAPERHDAQQRGIADPRPAASPNTPPTPPTPSDEEGDLPNLDPSTFASAQDMASAVADAIETSGLDPAYAQEVRRASGDYHAGNITRGEYVQALDNAYGSMLDDFNNANDVSPSEQNAMRGLDDLASTVNSSQFIDAPADEENVGQTDAPETPEAPEPSSIDNAEIEAAARRHIEELRNSGNPMDVLVADLLEAQLNRQDPDTQEGVTGRDVAAVSDFARMLSEGADNPEDRAQFQATADNLGGLADEIDGAVANPEATPTPGGVAEPPQDTPPAPALNGDNYEEDGSVPEPGPTFSTPEQDADSNEETPDEELVAWADEAAAAIAAGDTPPEAPAGVIGRGQNNPLIPSQIEALRDLADQIDDPALAQQIADAVDAHLNNSIADHQLLAEIGDVARQLGRDRNNAGLVNNLMSVYNGIQRNSVRNRWPDGEIPQFLVRNDNIVHPRVDDEMIQKALDNIIEQHNGPKRFEAIPEILQGKALVERAKELFAAGDEEGAKAALREAISNYQLGVDKVQEIANNNAEARRYHDRHRFAEMLLANIEQREAQFRNAPGDPGQIRGAFNRSAGGFPDHHGQMVFIGDRVKRLGDAHDTIEGTVVGWRGDPNDPTMRSLEFLIDVPGYNEPQRVRVSRVELIQPGPDHEANLERLNLPNAPVNEPAAPNARGRQDIFGNVLPEGWTQRNVDRANPNRAVYEYTDPATGRRLKVQVTRNENLSGDQRYILFDGPNQRAVQHGGIFRSWDEIVANVPGAIAQGEARDGNAPAAPAPDPEADARARADAEIDTPEAPAAPAAPAANAEGYVPVAEVGDRLRNPQLGDRARFPNMNGGYYEFDGEKWVQKDANGNSAGFRADPDIVAGVAERAGGDPWEYLPAAEAPAAPGTPQPPAPDNLPAVGERVRFAFPGEDPVEAVVDGQPQFLNGRWGVDAEDANGQAYFVEADYILPEEPAAPAADPNARLLDNLRPLNLAKVANPKVGDQLKSLDPGRNPSGFHYVFDGQFWQPYNADGSRSDAVSPQLPGSLASAYRERDPNAFEHRYDDAPTPDLPPTPPPSSPDVPFNDTPYAGPQPRGGFDREQVMQDRNGVDVRPGDRIEDRDGRVGMVFKANGHVRGFYVRWEDSDYSSTGYISTNYANRLPEADQHPDFRDPNAAAAPAAPAGDFRRPGRLPDRFIPDDGSPADQFQPGGVDRQGIIEEDNPERIPYVEPTDSFGVSSPNDPVDLAANPHLAPADPGATSRKWWKFGKRAGTIAQAARNRPGMAALAQIQDGSSPEAIAAIARIYGATPQADWNNPERRITFGSKGYWVKMSGGRKTTNGGYTSVSAQFSIMNADGRVIGTLNRQMTISDGNVEAYNAYMEINGASNKKSGFAAAYNRYMEDYYIANHTGTLRPKVRVTAALDNGAYVWGLNGFKFAGNVQSANAVASRFIDQVSRRVDSDDFRSKAQIAALRRKIAAGKEVTPLEVALIGWRPEYEGMRRQPNWPGKATMNRRGQSWSGEKFLDADDPVYKQNAAYRDKEYVKQTKERIRNGENVVANGADISAALGQPQSAALNPAASLDPSEVALLRQVLDEGQSMASISPGQRRRYHQWVSKALGDLRNGNNGPEVQRNAGLLLDLQQALLAEQRADFPARKRDLGVGEELRGKTFRDFQNNNIPGWTVSGTDPNAGNANDTFMATHDATGEVFFIKKDGLNHGGRDGREGRDGADAGRNSEVDVNRFLRAVGRQGMGINEPVEGDGTDEQQMVIMGRVGDDVPLAARPRNLGYGAAQVVQNAPQADYDDLVRLWVLDSALGSNERHVMNIQAATDDNGSVWFFPIDHGLAGGGLGWLKDPMQYARSMAQGSGRFPHYYYGLGDYIQRFGKDRFRATVLKSISDYRAGLQGPTTYQSPIFQQKMGEMLDKLEANIDTLVGFPTA